MVRSCESDEALDRLQTTQRQQLKAVSLARRELYEKIGQAVRSRRAALKPRPPNRKAKGNGANRDAARVISDSHEPSHA